MKNKKVLIVAIFVIIVCAIGFSIYKVRTNYLYNQDGTIGDGKNDLINQLKNIKDPEERKNQINFALEHNIITQQEADELISN